MCNYKLGPRYKGNLSHQTFSEGSIKVFLKAYENGVKWSREAARNQKQQWTDSMIIDDDFEELQFKPFLENQQ